MKALVGGKVVCVKGKLAHDLVVKKTFLSLLLAPGFLFAESRPFIIDDFEVIRNFEEKAGAFAKEKSFPSAKVLIENLKNPDGIDVDDLPEVTAPASLEESVYIVGSVYDCGRCDRWHPGGLATAWVMGAEGVFCTNYHVLKSLKGEALAVASITGEVFPVTKILLADEENDIAIFQVKASGLVPLPLAKEFAKVGSKVSCLSHPNQRFFHHSFGKVVRYHYQRKTKKVKTQMMSISADFAKGSSGGPIFNEKNEVVGVVRSTNSIYYKEDKEKGQMNLQMVMKSCVPAFVIQDLLKEAMVTT